jgi:hypothetical protein
MGNGGKIRRLVKLEPLNYYMECYRYRSRWNSSRRGLRPGLPREPRLLRLQRHPPERLHHGEGSLHEHPDELALVSEGQPPPDLVELFGPEPDLLPEGVLGIRHLPGLPHGDKCRGLGYYLQKLLREALGGDLMTIGGRRERFIS